MMNIDGYKITVEDFNHESSHVTITFDNGNNEITSRYDINQKSFLDHPIPVTISLKQKEEISQYVRENRFSLEEVLINELNSKSLTPTELIVETIQALAIHRIANALEAFVKTYVQR